MIKEVITIHDVVAFLNEALHADRSAMTKLCVNRIDCNKELLQHPTIQAVEIKNASIISPLWELLGLPQVYGRVGLLGILNGLFGKDDNGRGGIQAIFDTYCPKGCHLENMEFVAVGEKCPGCCGANIQLGDIIRFEVRK